MSTLYATAIATALLLGSPAAIASGPQGVTPATITPTTALSPRAEISGLRVEQVAEGVRVNWIISDTTGTLAYEVQRAPEGLSWLTVYTLQPTRALVLLDETFTDPIPIDGYNAYRVVAVKRDGRRVASPAAAIRYVPNDEVAIFPNPLTIGQPLSIVMLAPLNHDLEFEVIDDKGNTVETFSHLATGEREVYQILPDIAHPGTFAVRVLIDAMPAHTFVFKAR